MAELECGCRTEEAAMTTSGRIDEIHVYPCCPEHEIDLTIAALDVAAGRFAVRVCP
jgi:hypothetical protein